MSTIVIWGYSLKAQKEFVGEYPYMDFSQLNTYERR